MNALLITYELKGNKDYTGLYDVLKSAPGWWHYLDSTWIIKTEETTEVWADKLKPHIDEVADSMLVIEVKKSANHNGWLPKKAWNWIGENI